MLVIMAMLWRAYSLYHVDWVLGVKVQIDLTGLVRL